MLLMRDKRPAFRTLQGWAISVLLEAGAIRECEEHGWAQDRADPHAREDKKIPLRGPIGARSLPMTVQDLIKWELSTPPALYLARVCQCSGWLRHQGAYFGQTF